MEARTYRIYGGASYGKTLAKVKKIKPFYSDIIKKKSRKKTK